MKKRRLGTLEKTVGALSILLLSCVMCPSTVLAVCVCGGGDGIPLVFSPSAPLSMDGNMADWGSYTGGVGILADEDNNVCDGPSGQLVDLDDPVQSTGRDIAQFTFTYDDTYLYFYTERVGSATNVQTFLYYADVNNNGYMEDGEPAIAVEWQGSNRLVSVFVAAYDPVDGVNGDPTEDATGLGDGYSLPGSLKNIPKTPNYSGAFGSTSGQAMEFAVTWSDLGFSVPVGHTIHVASTNANKNASNLGAQIDDNLGGCGGGAGSTQYADLAFQGASTLQGYPGDILYGPHHLLNMGNGEDAFALASSATGTHTPAVSYYLDANSNGAFDGTATDTPITAPILLAAGESVDLIIGYAVSPAALPGLATVVTTATSGFNPAVFKSVSDAILALMPEMLVMKYVSAVADAAAHTSVDKAIPGTLVTYTVSAANVGNGSANDDSVVLSDSVPAAMEMYVGTGSVSPVTFDAGTSLLTYSFIDLASAADDISFTSESQSAPAFTYMPNPGADGFDPSVRGFRLNPKGSLAEGTGFSLTYRTRIR